MGQNTIDFVSKMGQSRLILS